jgi:hypothetical protein
MFLLISFKLKKQKQMLNLLKNLFDLTKRKKFLLFVKIFKFISLILVESIKVEMKIY